MPTQGVDKLHKQRQAVSLLIDLLHKEVDKFDESVSKFNLTITSSHCSEYSTQLKAIHSKIVDAVEDDESLEDACNAYAEINGTLDKVMRKILELQSAQTTSSKVLGGGGGDAVKLPKLDIPKFDGTYTKWLAFKDIFTATFINHSSLTDAQRLLYLQSCLEGEASGIVKHFSPTDANFSQAWAMVKERYDNQREIIFSILRDLTKQTSVREQSMQGLRKLLDCTNECVRSLQALDIDTQSWDTILVYLLVDKLDSSTKMEWSKSLSGSEVPKYKEVTNFLENLIRSLNLSQGTSTSTPKKLVSSKKTHFVSTEQKGCVICKSDHPIWKCEKFKSLSPEEKINKVKSNRLCFNCLNTGHSSKQCKSKYTCRECQQRHHSMLHLEKKSQVTGGQSTSTPSTSSSVAHGDSDEMKVHTMMARTSKVLLQTALAHVKDSNGRFRVVRVFMDSGSESSFITKTCVNSLGLKTENCNVSVYGLTDQLCGKATKCVNFYLHSTVNNFYVRVNALIQPRVTGTLPSFNSQVKVWSHLEGLEFADPKFLEPGKIDILLGADVYGILMIGQTIQGPINAPSATLTQLGWVISGPTGIQRLSNYGKVQVNFSSTNFDNLVSRFWELEEVPKHNNLTDEERYCENLFVSQHSRDEKGRYIAPVPYNSNILSLGASREVAIRRFLNIERKLEANILYGEQYRHFMREYLELNHMELIPRSECGEIVGKTNYLPHHFVTKEESTTTKLRVVFDGSFKTSTGVSLNDCLRVGCKYQDDLFVHLIRFRLKPIALKADIEKMYRQFLLPKEDMERHRIIWRFSMDTPLQEYRLRTVTYGTASASHSSIRCLQQLVKDEGLNFPLAANIVGDNFLVDDLLGGCETPEEGKLIYDELQGLMGKAQLKLRKWESNSKELLDKIPKEHRDRKEIISLSDNSLKALGIDWNTTSDTFHYSSFVPKLSEKVTKRTILSEVSRLFDPLGWLTPVTLRSKLIVQNLWKEKLDWDQDVSQALKLSWVKHLKDLTFISLVSIPRSVIPLGTTSISIQGFSDASELAYTGVVYVRVERDQEVNCFLLTAKSKVAPLKQVSLPRLELCGALLLIRLIQSVREHTKLDCQTTCWTDSELVLKWLSNHSRSFKTFVANRVAEIQSVLPEEHWRFVPGILNPADVASRGSSAEELVSRGEWWNGPEWLREPTVPLFKISKEVKLEDLEAKLMAHHTTTPQFDLLNKYSSLSKLRRVISYVYRFIWKIRKVPFDHSVNLSVEETSRALKVLIKIAQFEDFSEELSCLNSNSALSRKSRLLSLNPFIDSKGIMRVGGRLENLENLEISKHPIILSRQSSLTKLIIRDCHLMNCHSGFSLTLSTLRRDYWIISGRDAVRNILRKCILCRKVKAKSTTQLMGQLPKERLSSLKAFQNVGVDFAGPYNVLPIKGRGRQLVKSYICLFVCLTTKATHLEFALELSTESFLGALRRFISRRGKPSILFSDCGTNFVGARNELYEFINSNAFSSCYYDFSGKEGITWKFNPPAAPHMGGLWEAGVKSAKGYLRKIMGLTNFSLEEFATILCQVEAILNSRPLCALSPDPNDGDVLTPGHFLVGGPLNCLPEPNHTSININRLTRWQKSQQMVQLFWKKFYADYIHLLQQRVKWKNSQTNLELGDLVIVKEDNLPPLKWKVGRVIQVTRGQDQLVRVVKVRVPHLDGSEVKFNEFDRPVAKICVLLSSSEV